MSPRSSPFRWSSVEPSYANGPGVPMAQVKHLRDQAKDDVKIDESYIQESKVDGGSADEDEDEY